MTGDTARWLGTVTVAGLLAVLSILGTIILAIMNRPIPMVLTTLDTLATVGYILPVATMAGARAAENGARAAANQQST